MKGRIITMKKDLNESDERVGEFINFVADYCNDLSECNMVDPVVDSTNDLLKLILRSPPIENASEIIHDFVTPVSLQKMKEQYSNDIKRIRAAIERKDFLLVDFHMNVIKILNGSLQTDEGTKVYHEGKNIIKTIIEEQYEDLKNEIIRFDENEEVKIDVYQSIANRAIQWQPLENIRASHIFEEMPNSLRDFYFEQIFALLKQHTEGISISYFCHKSPFVPNVYSTFLALSNYIGFSVNFAYDSDLESFMQLFNQNERSLKKVEKMTNLASDITAPNFMPEEIRRELMRYRSQMYEVIKRVFDEAEGKCSIQSFDEKTLKGLNDFFNGMAFMQVCIRLHESPMNMASRFEECSCNFVNMCESQNLELQKLDFNVYDKGNWEITLDKFRLVFIFFDLIHKANQDDKLDWLEKKIDADNLVKEVQEMFKQKYKSIHESMKGILEEARMGSAVIDKVKLEHHFELLELLGSFEGILQQEVNSCVENSDLLFTDVLREYRGKIQTFIDEQSIVKDCNVPQCINNAFILTRVSPCSERYKYKGLNIYALFCFENRKVHHHSSLFRHC